jgi:hypothetical protein
MFRQYLDKIEGIAAYPLFSFVVFFLFFAAVAVWVWKADRSHLDALGRLPLDDEGHNNPNQK